MDKYVVIINGLGGVGKSEFINQCKKIDTIEGFKVGVSEKSTVDYIKKVAKMCGWDGSKTQKDRIFLSDLKKTFEAWDDRPLQYLYGEIDKEFKRMEKAKIKKGVIFINSRELKDIEKITIQMKDEGATVIKLLVENDRVDSNEVPELVDDIMAYRKICNYTINNNGTFEQLFISALYFLKDILDLKGTNKNEEKTSA